MELHSFKRLVLRRFKALDRAGFSLTVKRVFEPEYRRLCVQFLVGQELYRLEFYERERSTEVRLRRQRGEEAWNTLKRLPFYGEKQKAKQLLDRLFYLAA